MTPAEIKSLETYLRRKFSSDDIEVRKRPKKQDSVEVFMKEEFIAVIYKDDEDDEVSYHFQMTILEADLKGQA